MFRQDLSVGFSVAFQDFCLHWKCSYMIETRTGNGYLLFEETRHLESAGLALTLAPSFPALRSWTQLSELLLSAPYHEHTTHLTQLQKLINNDRGTLIKLK